MCCTRVRGHGGGAAELQRTRHSGAQHIQRVNIGVRAEDERRRTLYTGAGRKSCERSPARSSVRSAAIGRGQWCLLPREESAHDFCRSTFRLAPLCPPPPHASRPSRSTESHRIRPRRAERSSWGPSVCYLHGRLRILNIHVPLWGGFLIFLSRSYSVQWRVVTLRGVS